MAALQRVQSKRCVREARCGRREAPVEEGEHQEDDPHQPQQEPDGGMGHHGDAAEPRRRGRRRRGPGGACRPSSCTLRRRRGGSVNVRCRCHHAAAGGGDHWERAGRHPQPVEESVAVELAAAAIQAG